MLARLFEMSLADAGLSGHSIFGLVVFFVVMVFVIRPVKIPIPRTLTSAAAKVVHKLRSQSKSAGKKNQQPESQDLGSQYHLPLNLMTAPILGVLLLLATKTITFSNEVKLGIVGENGVKPFSIMILFLALAYVSLSLDSTGILRAAAFWVMQKTSRPVSISQARAERPEQGAEREERQYYSNGLALFSALYFLFLILSALVGNDAVILSGTAFLSYFIRVSGIEPDCIGAWILSEFWAANIGSMASRRHV